MNTSELLDSIEEQIKEIEVKLANINQKRLAKGLNSEEHAKLESERRTLKKDLIDLDYQHKLYCERLRTEKLAHKLNSKSIKESKTNERENG